MARTWTSIISAALCVFISTAVLPVHSDNFLDLSFIQDPARSGNVRIVPASMFSDRVTWLFPFLNLSRSGNLTGWVFRVHGPPPQPWTPTTANVPSFDLWQENIHTPRTIDYRCIHCRVPIGAVELYDKSNQFVYKQTLDAPLVIDSAKNYILGINFPSSGASNLNLSLQRDEADTAERLSYFFTRNNTFFTISTSTYRDNRHIPLVRPLYATVTPPPTDTDEETLSPTPSVASPTGIVEGTVTPLTHSVTAETSTPPPTLPTSVPDGTSSNQPSIALIIGAVIVALVVITLSLLVIVLLVKYHQLRFGKRNTHLENPTYQVPDNRAHTGKSTSSNGSFHAYANPAPATFLSAALPPLPSHQVSPHIPPPLILHHYEVEEQQPVYAQPGHKATTVPPPLPYEVPMLPSRDASTKHHVYSELECGELPSLPTQLQEDKKSLISGSQSSSIFDNSIYKEPNSLVPRGADGGGNDDLYWKPASSSQLLYDQLSQRKFPEILKDDITLTEHLGSGQFGMVNKGVWQSPDGSVTVAVKQLQLKATELDRVRFLQEAAIMGQFYHPNVVALHGVVTKDDPIMIVLEYMPNGDLRNSLLNICPQPHTQVPDTLPLLLLRFCQEVATGMAYLSKKAFVHRDLAARNILLDRHSTCKIGDFGMSRDLEDSDYYITHGGIIPVKWTAPEALHYKKYSTASDVWSFGCLMYEIWSLGHKPFEQYGNMDCIQMVSQGWRLPPPAGCCRALYKLMILCWHTVPSQRPVFPEMQHVLTHLNTQLLENVDPHLGRLGGPLEAGEGVYADLQDYYLQDQTGSSSDSR